MIADRLVPIELDQLLGEPLAPSERVEGEDLVLYMPTRARAHGAQWSLWHSGAKRPSTYHTVQDAWRALDELERRAA